MENFDVFAGQQPSNQIWYTSIDGSVITPIRYVNWGKIISNTYTDNKGVITFDRDMNEVAVSFSSDKLTSISFPDCSTFIGDIFFTYQCKNLRRIKYKDQDGRNLIHDNVLIAVANGDLDRYEIPGGLTVKRGAFVGEKDKLRVIKIGKGTHLQEGALLGLSNVKRIYGEHATARGKSWIENNVLIAFACGDATHCDIPEGVTRIGAWAFFKSHLKTIRIPKSVKEVGFQAFGDLKKLKMKGPNATRDGKYLVVDGNLLLYFEDSSLQSTAPYSYAYVIPSSVKRMDRGLFWGRYVFPEGMEELNIQLNDNVFGRDKYHRFPKLELEFSGSLPDDIIIREDDFRDRRYHEEYDRNKQSIQDAYDRWKTGETNFGWSFSPGWIHCETLIKGFSEGKSPQYYTHPLIVLCMQPEYINSIPRQIKRIIEEKEWMIGLNPGYFTDRRTS